MGILKFDFRFTINKLQTIEEFRLQFGHVVLQYVLLKYNISYFKMSIFFPVHPFLGCVFPFSPRPSAHRLPPTLHLVLCWLQNVRGFHRCRFDGFVGFSFAFIPIIYFRTFSLYFWLVFLGPQPTKLSTMQWAVGFYFQRCD